MKFVYLYPSQYRVLKALYFSTGRTANQLIEEAKVAYPADCVQHLRGKGIEIYTEYIPNPNELSHRQIADYSISPESKQLALSSIRHYMETR